MLACSTALNMGIASMVRASAFLAGQAHLARTLSATQTPSVRPMECAIKANVFVQRVGPEKPVTWSLVWTTAIPTANASPMASARATTIGKARHAKLKFVQTSAQLMEFVWATVATANKVMVDLIARSRMQRHTKCCNKWLL